MAAAVRVPRTCIALPVGRICTPQPPNPQTACAEAAGAAACTQALARAESDAAAAKAELGRRSGEGLDGAVAVEALDALERETHAPRQSGQTRRTPHPIRY